MDNDSFDKNSEIRKATKKGGKEILTGISRGGMLFTKRVAEGALNAQTAKSNEKETFDKVKAAGNELGKAIIKGAIEGAAETLHGIRAGVTTISDAINKGKRLNDEDEP